MSADIAFTYPHTRRLLAKKRATMGYKPIIVKTKSFEYDESYLTGISQDLIDRFIEYQTRYLTKINDCIYLFVHCVELLENEHNIRLATGKPINLNIICYRENKMRENMQKIYDILEWEYHILMGLSLTDRTNPENKKYNVYSWMKFITSQSQLNQLIIL